MNIFYLDRNLTKCAQSHCDKHVNKMILESGQLLATAIHLGDPELAKTIPNLYKMTHKNHPSAIWARQSINHYLYLLDLMEALNEECQFRYGHSNVHVTLAKLRDWPYPVLSDVRFSEPPRCMPDDLKAIPDTVEAYRAYYKRDKLPIAAWTKREPPDWW